MKDHVARFEEAQLERLAARARRRTREGRASEALGLYASLVPEIHRLAPHRQLRLIGGYAELLQHSEGVLAFERLRGLARRAVAAYSCCKAGPAGHLVHASRQVRRLQAALFGIARGIGPRSAIGRSSLRRVRDLEWVAEG